MNTVLVGNVMEGDRLGDPNAHGRIILAKNKEK
jgi:hypothetical protein